MFGTCDRCGATCTRVYLANKGDQSGACGACIATISSVFRVVYSPTEMAYATIESGTVEWHHSAKRAKLGRPDAQIRIVTPQDFHGILAMHRVKWDAGIAQ